MLQGFGALVRNIARKTARYEEGEKELQLQRSKLRTKKNQNKSTNEIGISPICRPACVAAKTKSNLKNFISLKI